VAAKPLRAEDRSRRMAMRRTSNVEPRTLKFELQLGLVGFVFMGVCFVVM
jgi:hypothetical protein